MVGVTSSENCSNCFFLCGDSVANGVDGTSVLVEVSHFAADALTSRAVAATC